MPATTALDFVVRRVTTADLPAFTAYWNDLEAREPKFHGYTLAQMQDIFGQPRMAYTRWYLAETTMPDGSRLVIGNADSSTPSDGDLTAWGELNVHPDYRNNGVGTALYDTLLADVAEHGASSLRVNPHLRSTLLIDFLRKRGFELERYLWTLRLTAEMEVEAVTIPPGYHQRDFVPGQDDALLIALVNGAFSGQFDHQPLTLEMLKRTISKPDFKPADIQLAFSGDQPAGVCWTEISPHEIEDERGIGVVHTLGVLPGHRCVGLGRALLLYAIHYLRQRTATIELGVEGKNAKALSLYESVGFKQQRGWVNMVKPLEETTHA